MNNHPPNVEPLNWIMSANDQARRHRANIVCWRNSSALLWEMVARHSALTLHADDQLPANPMRILGSTRHLVTCLVALKARVMEWCARLHAERLDCSAIDAACRQHREILERMDDWEVGSLFSGITQEANTLVETYRMLEKLTFRDIETAAKSIHEVGGAAEQAALTSAE